MDRMTQDFIENMTEEELHVTSEELRHAIEQTKSSKTKALINSIKFKIDMELRLKTK